MFDNRALVVSLEDLLYPVLICAAYGGPEG